MLDFASKNSYCIRSTNRSTEKSEVWTLEIWQLTTDGDAQIRKVQVSRVLLVTAVVIYYDMHSSLVQVIASFGQRGHGLLEQGTAKSLEQITTYRGVLSVRGETL